MVERSGHPESVKMTRKEGASYRGSKDLSISKCQVARDVGSCNLVDAKRFALV